MSAHLLSIGGAALMLLAAIATGNGILSLAGIAPRASERPLFALALGVGAQGTLLLALSALGWMHPAALWAAVVLPALPGLRAVRDLRAALSGIRAWFEAMSSAERISVAAVAAVAGAILLVGALAPVMDWDSLMYHAQLPRLILERGVLHVPADGLHLPFLGSFQFLYLPLLAVGAESGPSLLNAAMVAALGISLAVAGTRLFGRQAGLLVFIAIWGSSSLFLVGTTPRIDVTLLFVLFLAHYAVVLALEEGDAGHIRLAALVAGVAIGMKYHALPYLAALAPFALWALWQTAPRQRLLRDVALVAGLSLLVAAPWLLKNQVLFGGPLYPFFSERLVPPFIADLLGSRTHPAEVSTAIYSALGNARERISIAALLFRPAQLTVEAEGAHFTRNAALFVLPLALLFLRDRRLLVLLVPGALYLTFALSYFAKTNLRYLMPALPVMVLCAVEGARRFGARFERLPAVRPLLLVLALATALGGLRVAGSRLATPVRVQVALGMLPPEALLAGDVQYAVARFMADETPADSRLLMLFDARGYYHTRAVIQDNVLTNWPLLLATGAPDRCLAGTGITHVLVNNAVADYYVRRGLDPNVLGYDRFPEFAQRCLEPMVNNLGVVIYRVR